MPSGARAVGSSVRACSQEQDPGAPPWGTPNLVDRITRTWQRGGRGGHCQFPTTAVMAEAEEWDARGADGRRHGAAGIARSTTPPIPIAPPVRSCSCLPACHGPRTQTASHQPAAHHQSTTSQITRRSPPCRVLSSTSTVHTSSRLFPSTSGSLHSRCHGHRLFWGACS